MTQITNGALLVGIGVVHSAFGLLTGAGLLAPPGGPPRNLLAEIARDGVLGAIEPDPLRSVLFWFLFFGLLVMILGGLVHRIERDGGRPPGALAWQLGALGLAGGLLIPASGFWLLLPVALRLHHRR
jgi:hypothetical protein